MSSQIAGERLISAAAVTGLPNLSGCIQPVAVFENCPSQLSEGRERGLS